MPRISIINSGIGNIASVKFAFEAAGAEVSLVNEAAKLDSSCDAAVLPGVGNFRHAMEHLSSRGYPDKLRSAVLDDGLPFLGICLGMQLLADEGEEGGPAKGLGLIPGRVVRLAPPPQFRIPHMGWDDVDVLRREPLFSGLPDGPSFYFVHSYYFDAEAECVSAECDYGGKFPVAVQKGSIFGTQFHPEKSQRNGELVVANFLDYIRR